MKTNHDEVDHRYEEGRVSMNMWNINRRGICSTIYLIKSAINW